VTGYRPDKDHRQFLYVEYLQVIADNWPAVFVMENVKGLLSANVNGARLFEMILRDLQSPADALRREHRVFEPTRRAHQYRVLPLSAEYTGDSLDVRNYVVASERHGVPQARHRVILVGVRDDLGDMPAPTLPKVNQVAIARVIDDLPRLRSGLSRNDSTDRWLDTVTSAIHRRWLGTAGKKSGTKLERLIVRTVMELRPPKLDRGARFIEGNFTPQYAPRWYADRRLGGITHHQTRGHFDVDLHRYLFVSAFGHIHRRSPSLAEFPKDLLPAHDNVRYALTNGGYFSDRFRVQLSIRPASTITSHIAKDGHYYIHHDPSQCRSLTLREAARVQTFPDNYFFCGNRTAGYTQVGNAVPPLLAKSIASCVYGLLKNCGAA